MSLTGSTHSPGGWLPGAVSEAEPQTWVTQSPSLYIWIYLIGSNDYKDSRSTPHHSLLLKSGWTGHLFRTWRPRQPPASFPLPLDSDHWRNIEVCDDGALSSFRSVRLNAVLCNMVASTPKASTGMLYCENLWREEGSRPEMELAPTSCLFKCNSLNWERVWTLKTGTPIFSIEG